MNFTTRLHETFVRLHGKILALREGLALRVLIFFCVNNSIYGSWFLIWELFVHSELF
jgi:hypothetical protein